MGTDLYQPDGLIQLFGESIGNFQPLEAGKGDRTLGLGHPYVDAQALPENVCRKPGDTKESYDLSLGLMASWLQAPPVLPQRLAWAVHWRAKRQELSCGTQPASSQMQARRT